MLSVTRHRVPPEQAEDFIAAAQSAVDLLRGQAGFETATVGRATDDPELWVVATSWQDVGSFRHAMSAYDVKVGVVPFLANALDEPTAYERLLVADGDSVTRSPSDRANDADWGSRGR